MNKAGEGEHGSEDGESLYVNSLGERIADDWTDLTDGNNLQNSMFVSASGVAVSPSGNVPVTATNQFGDHVGIHGTCGNYTGTGDSSGTTNPVSLKLNGLVDCDRVFNYMICMGQ